MSEQIRPHGIDDPTRVASVRDVEKINAQIERVQAKSDARLAQLLEIERTSKALIEAEDAPLFTERAKRYGEARAAWRKAVMG